MVVSGKYEFDVDKSKLWEYLMDPVVLAKITPGVSELETIDENNYISVSAIKIGPVKGSFKGSLSVVDKCEPDSFGIHMEQKSKIGNAQVKVTMELIESSTDKTELIFDGKANLSGVIARTGQRVLSGVATHITKEVFQALEKHIEEDKNKFLT